MQAQLRRGVWFILVQWAGLPEEEATWEQRDEFRQHYPDFQLEDELFVWSIAGRGPPGISIRGLAHKLS